MKYSAIFIIPILMVAACGRDGIETYQVPKETPQPAAQVASSKPAEAMHAPASPTPEFSANLSPGWVEQPGSGMRIISYSIEGTSIDFYLIALAMGDLPSNVNRWRGQIGLSSVSSEEIKRSVERFFVDGREINYTELYNEEAGTGIIAAIVDLAPKYWYFTAKGSAEELKAHAADIRNFLKTLEIHH